LGTLLAVLGLEKYISKFHTNSLSWGPRLHNLLCI
jgi:hypothetical protein